MNYENLIEDYGTHEKLIEKIVAHSVEGWRLISCSPYYFELINQGTQMQAVGWRAFYERPI